MEESHSQKTPPFSFLRCLFILSTVFIPSAAYVLPDQYFINCGSASTTFAFGRQNFVGDVNSSRVFALSSGNNNPVEDPSLSDVDQLYRSARIFTKPSWYEFDITQNGTFVVRFHFLSFSTMGKASDAHFSVVAPGYSLLSNFKPNSTNLRPHIEEFFVTVPVGKFKIQFLPSSEHSFAFANAVEVFLAPPRFIPDSAPRVTPERSNGDYTGLLQAPLRVIHRINVGGPNIMPNNDTLLRRWIPDDAYLFNKKVAIEKSYPGKPLYQNGSATEFDAPDFVYRTARAMNINNNLLMNLFNITWQLEVKNGTEYLMRVHFCDIVSDTPNVEVKFNLYIYSQFSYSIAPFFVIPQLAAPFYRDFVVNSDYSGFISVSVGPPVDAARNQTAFLNGIEIMELIGERSTEINDHSTNHLFLILALVLGIVILVLVVIVLMLCLRRRKMRGIEAFDRPLVPFYGGSSYSKTTEKTVTGSPLVDLNLGLKIQLSEILYATKNFDNKLMVGEGGFGKVFKGMLRNGTKVAVKRSQPGSGQGLSEFQTEIMVLSKIRHNHLVSLIGYCDERDEMILVYEFMENGTLRDHLYRTESWGLISQSKLSWDRRVQICIGAAKGIHYLHTGSSGVIIHRDIKSTNILLDEQYVAKVADFGLSTSGPLDQTHVSTDVKGSFGYLDPEYFRHLQLTQKSDVYSFGVVLLEILCARPVIDQSLPREQVSLADWGMAWLTKGHIEKIVDPFLAGMINPESLRKFGETIGKCLEEKGTDRPSMIDVMWDLEYSLKLQRTVKPREPYEDSETDLGLSMPVLQRLPSHNIPFGEDDSSSFIYGSQVDGGEVFSMLKIDEAR